MGLVTAPAEGTFPFPKAEFAQNILYPYGTEGMDIEQVFFC
jgi:hypothetical protein